MRPFVLIVGVVLLAIGLFIAYSAAIALQSCEAENGAPCTDGVCPVAIIACSSGAVLFGVGMAIVGAALLPFGIWTKSANRITEEVLAGLNK
jgi:hypothetical protein